MLIIPAIDLYNGKVVRLIEGKKQNMQIYSDNPLNVAEKFHNFGIKRIHIVDLNAAFGEENNRDIIKDIVKNIDVEVEVGGGIRNLKIAEELFSYGVNSIIIGTMMVKDFDSFEKIVSLYKDKIIAGVDVEEKYVRISGWCENTKVDYVDLLLRVKNMGIKQTIVTDISRDGTLKGINPLFYKEVALKTGLDVVASGGVSNIEDIKRLKKVERFGVIGVIIGKAIYENKINLKEILCLG
jgi:phosphoribosylformimino-5-aminoimidazole carboxamide ribotide isomerase